jgi:hypothetical protein
MAKIRPVDVALSRATARGVGGHYAISRFRCTLSTCARLSQAEEQVAKDLVRITHHRVPLLSRLGAALERLLTASGAQLWKTFSVKR